MAQGSEILTERRDHDPVRRSLLFGSGLVAGVALLGATAPVVAATVLA
jgi:hypothetical protein